ncbi:hypothetical protein FRC17_006169 [Serendipita sp. 399]|nr:hypothetical protein FRC17_006169 [Serendipita sp. 399]
MALSQAREAFNTHSANSQNLQQAYHGITRMYFMKKLQMNPEEESSQLYEQFYSSLDDYISQSRDITKTQWILAEKVASELKQKIHDMELELDGWRSSLELADNGLKYLRSACSQIEKEISSAKRTFHPLRRIPSDLWIDIFNHVVDGEVHDYFQRNSNLPLRSTPYILSQVCRLWRQIVIGKKSLWCFVAAHPFRIWSSNKYALFSNTIHKSGSPLSLVVNLSQSLSWSSRVTQKEFIDAHGQRMLRNINVFENNLGQVVSGNANFLRLSNVKPYELHMDMEEDQESIVQRASQIPYKSPSALVVSSRGPLKDGELHSILHGFTEIEALTIRNARPVALPRVDFSSTHTKLSSLTLTIGKFPENFQLDGYLTQTLTALYIRDNNATSLPTPTTNLQLPNVRVLGINYPARGFLEKVELKILAALVWYPCSVPGAGLITVAQALTTYGQLTDIRFDEWSQPDAEQCDGAVGSLSRMVQYTPALQSLAFEQCYVDGGALIELISRSKEKEAAESLAKLEQIVLSHTEGITRDHCDELKQMGTKIKVFR